MTGKDVAYTYEHEAISTHFAWAVYIGLALFLVCTTIDRYGDETIFALTRIA